jgi:hypothetical protein
MRIKLVKRKDQIARLKEETAKPKPVDPATAAKQWVEEYKERKANELARSLSILNNEAA